MTDPSNDAPTTTRQIRSLVAEDGTLRLALVDTDLGPVGPDEVLVRVEAAPINPSDLGLLLAGADPATLRADGPPDRPALVADLPPGARATAAPRVGRSLPVGNEGAGTVVAAGSSARARDLLGRTVAMVGGAMYSDHRLLPASLCRPLPRDR
jgi:NADPH:quinone reductase-like Zn-dependent oxidoreductase